MTFDKKFVDYVPGKAITDVHINRENDRYLSGKDYLIEILLLSMCNSFIAARGFGPVGVMLFAEHFENTFAFDLGRY